MKKMFKTIPFVAVAVAVVVSTSAMGAGSENNWKLSLQFKTGTAEDLLPVEVGTGVSTEEVLKPPHMPGKETTGDAEDAYVRAYIKTSSAKQTGRAIETINKNVWAIEVEAEEAGHNVTVAIDTKDFYTSYYPITIVSPGSSTPVKDIFNASQAANVDLFTSDGSPRTVYLIAGSSKSFAAASGENNEIIGIAVTPGVGRMANTEVKLFSSSCVDENKTTTTDENGMYIIDGVADLEYKVQVKKPLHLGSECTVTVEAQGTRVSVCDPVYAGNFNGDPYINLSDLSKMKPAYGKTSSSEGWNADYDLNGDDQVNLSDISVFKLGFGKTESITCGQ